jgi:hypothetical protein
VQDNIDNIALAGLSREGVAPGQVEKYNIVEIVGLAVKATTLLRNLLRDILD